MKFTFIIIFLSMCLSIALPIEVLAFDWAASGNPSNDKLLKMPEDKQAETLSRATRSACQGKSPFYMGTERRPPNQNVSFWTLSCSNVGGSFMIAIAPDSVGTTRVISCNLLRGHPWTCNKKLSDEK